MAHSHPPTSTATQEPGQPRAEISQSQAQPSERDRGKDVEIAIKRSLGIHQFRPNALNPQSLKEEVTLNPNSRSWQQQDQRSPGPGLSSKARPWKQCKCHMPQQRISLQNGKDPASSGPNTIAIRCFFVTDRPMKRSHHRVSPFKPMHGVFSSPSLHRAPCSPEQGAKSWVFPIPNRKFSIQKRLFLIQDAKLGQADQAQLGWPQKQTNAKTNWTRTAMSPRSNRSVLD